MRAEHLPCGIPRALGGGTQEARSREKDAAAVRGKRFPEASLCAGVQPERFEVSHKDVSFEAPDIGHTKSMRKPYHIGRWSWTGRRHHDGVTKPRHRIAEPRRRVRRRRRRACSHDPALGSELGQCLVSDHISTERSDGWMVGGDYFSDGIATRKVHLELTQLDKRVSGLCLGDDS